MRIILYKSSLCPRCRIARKHLAELLSDFDNYELEIVDILTAPIHSWQEGIRMIPTITAGKKKLSGFLITKQDIADFLAQIEK